MRIDLDDLICCNKCGILFNFRICGKQDDTYYNDWEGICPNCKERFYVND